MFSVIPHSTNQPELLMLQVGAVQIYRFKPQSLALPVNVVTRSFLNNKPCVCIYFTPVLDANLILVGDALSS
jgi:hypothetical protein